MSRFNNAFVLEALYIILKFNYVHINNTYYHQHKGGAMGAPCMVVVSNLVVAFLEKRMFAILPQVFPLDFVDFFIRNYFRFIDDVIHKWLSTFDIDLFRQILNNLDEDLQFELDQIARQAHYLDVHTSATDSIITFDIYYKPTNSFAYLRFNSCHPRHTIENLAGSLARRIIQIVSNNRDVRLVELEQRLIDRGHPSNVITRSMGAALVPIKKPKEGEPIVFTHTHSPRLNFDKSVIHKCISDIRTPGMRKAFKDKWVLVSTRQPANLRRMLTAAKFIRHPIPREPRRVGLEPCGTCSYCRKGYVVAATGFKIQNSRGETFEWTYNRLFTCNSKNVLYVVFCVHPPDFYLGKTDDTKQRMRKHASDVRHPNNSKCRICSEHLRECSGLVEPYFTMYPFYYEDDPHSRHVIERRFIEWWKPHLNGQ